MSRTLRTILAVVFVGIITFCAIILCQNIGKTLRMDVTEQKLYTLSDGTRSVLAKLNQPLKLRLYYAKTATLKAPDQIRFYNNYYDFVKTLLAEYARASKQMVQLEIIDPRPFSDDEEEALRYGLKRFPISEEENFFFGLVLQTQFGVVRTIPFFSPERQNFVEYDISHLIDTAVTRQKKRIGIMSSLPVMGEDTSGYMAQLRRMQKQQPRPPWTIVRQLQQQYDVNEVSTDVEQIKDVDILLVIHPKDLPEKTLFAIDQYVLKGGRAMFFVDPRCFVDTAANPLDRQQSEPVSNLNGLLSKWGVKMLENAFAGDRSLAMPVRMDRNERLQNLIGYLQLTGDCFNRHNVVTSNLNQVRMLFAGALVRSEAADANDEAERQVIPLLGTTSRGNTWSVEGPWDWVRINPERMITYFSDGSKPIVMSYLIKGRLKSNFPDGIEITEDSGEKTDNKDQDTEKPETKTVTRKLTGLTESSGECAVLVFSDVDFISDIVAYQDTVFGMKIAVGNNSDLVLNALDDLAGSSELIGVRSRGNFRRPFVVVDDIRARAEQKHAEEVAKLQAEIKRLETELNQVVSSAKKGQEDLIAKSIVDKQRQLETEIRRTRGELRDVQKKRYASIEQLGMRLQNLNMWSAPGVILLIAVVLTIRRRLLRRRHVSHASDA